jgi:methylmalonyl-CoA/ethylmalonyl-CoA epimerase
MIPVMRGRWLRFAIRARIAAARIANRNQRPHPSAEVEKPWIDHVAVGVWSFDDALPVVVDVLGGRPGRGGPSPGFDWRTWTFRGGGALEVIVPTGSSDGFLHRYLRSRGPGIHHVTFYVPNLREACDRAESRGYRVVGYDDSRPDWQEAFLHPQEANGIVVQLAVSSPEHEAEGYGREAPVEQLEAPEPVTLTGLRAAAPSSAAARKLWEEVLLGDCRERTGALLFRWPGSPMRIAVSIDPALPVGPLALEVETEREIPLLDRAPSPSFGARIARARDV